MAYKRTELKEVRQRKYLARDFDGFRAILLDYARRYYPDRIQDFSENSLGGLFLDFAAVVGDNLSFYLDHQFSELNPETAIELINIQRQLRAAGVPIVGAAPSIVKPMIYVQVPAEITSGMTAPMSSAIPIVNAGSIFVSTNGTEFILLDDLDFSQSDNINIQIGQKTSAGIPTTFILSAQCTCVSGKTTSESFQIDSTFVPFRRITLAQPNVSEIVSVSDSLGNVYYQVAALTHDVVYRSVLNMSSDNDVAPYALKVVPAPYRFIADVDLSRRQTTLTFGGGNANTLEDDVIPDPSDFAISLPYTKTFSRISVNPESLLSTKTLGVAATNTTLTVTYRYGGGLSHNVPRGNVSTVKMLKLTFPNNPSQGIAQRVRSSIEVDNPEAASGGEDAPSINDLKSLIPSIRNSQDRIASRPDLLARIYTLPTNFGRAFRVAVRTNPNNPMTSLLYVISRNIQKQLVPAPDMLKENIVRYLNPYRMISDAIDVLDSPVVNLQVLFDVLIDPSMNKSTVLQSVITRLQTFFDVTNFHIDQPIMMSDVTNVIYSTAGIMSVNNLKFVNIIGLLNNREYSDVTFDTNNTIKGIMFPPTGGIFEVRYPDVDIIGKASA